MEIVSEGEREYVRDVSVEEVGLVMYRGLGFTMGYMGIESSFTGGYMGIESKGQE